MVLSVSGITREPQASGMLVSGRNRKFIETNWLLREQAKGFAKIHCPIVLYFINVSVSFVKPEISANIVYASKEPFRLLFLNCSEMKYGIKLFICNSPCDSLNMLQ